jgi:hypothetical protein
VGKSNKPWTGIGIGTNSCVCLEVNTHTGILDSCEFKGIIVFKDFEVENGVLGLEQDVYLNIVKFLDLIILRKSMSKYFLFFLIFYLFLL